MRSELASQRLSSEPADRSRGRAFVRALACGLIALILAGPLHAQAPGSKEEAAEAPAAERVEPAIVSVSEIVPAAELIEREIAGIERLLDQRALAEQIEGALPDLAQSIARQRARQTTLLESPTLQDVESVQSQWLELRSDLPGWRERLASRAAELEDARERLGELEALWTRSLRNAEEEGAPASIVARARELVSGLRAERERLDARRAELLTLQGDVIDRAAEIEDEVERLEDLRSQLVRRVFERDAEPIWVPIASGEFSEGLGSRLRTVLDNQVRDLTDFATEQRDRLPLHALALVALVLLLRHARTRVRSRSEEEVGLTRVAEIFEFPISIGLLLAILLAPWLYGFVPPVVGQILGFAALVPTVVILRGLVAPPLFPLLNALIVFYFMDRLRVLTGTLPVVSRSIFLLELVVAVGLLAWLMRPSRLAEIPQWAARSTLLHVLGRAGQVALVLFALALVAEVLGYSRFGHLVGGGVLDSAYVAVVAYAALRVLDSLVTFALRVRPLGWLRMVQRKREVIRRRVMRALRIVAVATWAVITLDRFALWTPAWEAIRAALAARAEIGSITISAGDVGAFVVTVVIAFAFSRFLRFVLEEDVYPRMRLGRGVPYAISTFAHYIILLVGFVLAVAAMGIDLDRFALLAGAFGVGIGFGLQNVVNNFVSGLILLSERPIQVGDTIEAGDDLGEVARIGIRSSTVRTWDGAEMIVPNAELISQRVTNWTLSDRQRRIDVPVGVAYGTDRRKVLELLREVARAHDDILDEPAPNPLFMGFGDSSLDFELRAWTGELKNIARIKSDLAMAIGDALAEAGIEVPFPQRDLNLRTITPEVAEGLGAAARGSRTERSRDDEADESA